MFEFPIIENATEEQRAEIEALSKSWRAVDKEMEIYLSTAKMKKPWGRRKRAARENAIVLARTAVMLAMKRADDIYLSLGNEGDLNCVSRISSF